MDFVQAKYYKAVSVKRRIDFIVLHDMEMAEQPTTAEACARYFQNPSSPSSAHYCVDSDSIVQCVRENDIAYHAPPNTHSLGVEHAGYARQTRAQWLDPYGLAMLRLSTRLVRELCNKYDIPKVFLSPADLRAGRRGITTHANVSKAFGQSTHTDPGPNFPVDHYMAMVKAVDPKPPTPPVSLEDDDMPMQRYTARDGRGEFVITASGAVHLKNETHRDLLLAEGRVSATPQTITVAELDALLEKE